MCPPGREYGRVPGGGRRGKGAQPRRVWLSRADGTSKLDRAPAPQWQQAPGTSGHRAQRCPQGWSRTCSTPQPWGQPQALASRPDPSPGCSGHRVGLRVLVSVTGAAGSCRQRPQLTLLCSMPWQRPQAAAVEQVPVPFPRDASAVTARGRCWGDSGNLPRSRRSSGALGPCGSLAHPCTELWGPVAFCPLAGTPWAGCGVAGGGRCRLPRSSPSAGLQRTSAGLGNNKLKQGLLLMFKKPEAE